MKPAGRPRDPDIDEAIRKAARRNLAIFGVEAMSISTIAMEAETTRQSVYRRWPSKEHLAAAAVLDVATIGTAVTTDDAYADFLHELQDFATFTTAPTETSLVGTVLQDCIVPEIRAGYRTAVVAPRRARLKVILEQAKSAKLIDADGEIETAISMATGAWYARALAQDDTPTRWADKVARLTWRALGGRDA